MSAPHSDTMHLDVIAASLTPDALAPFSVPIRTIPLGHRDTFCIRTGYLSRDVVDGAPERTLEAMPRSVGLIVQRLTASFGSDRVRTSLDALCAAVAPDVLVRELAEALSAGQLLVIATPVRALSKVFDHPGPPEDASRRREWTFPELQAFLDAEGLDVVFGGIAVRSAGEQPDATGETAVMVATGRAPSHRGRVS